MAEIKTIAGSAITNEDLQEAFMPWVNRVYPEAKVIGDVVAAMRLGDIVEVADEVTPNTEGL